MGTILFFDTSIGTFNHGDDIIMRSVYRAFNQLLKNNYRLNYATHLVNYTSRYADEAKIQSCMSTKMKFICGTDILWPNPFDQIKRKQLQISSIVNKPSIYCGSILLGAGIKNTDRMIPDHKSISLYNRVLSHEYIHSVRDDSARALLNSMGFMAINTGCPTLWMLDEEFCKGIPCEKSDACVLALTSEKKNRILDSKLIQIVKENYSKVYFWVQRWTDDEYLLSLTNCADIEFIYDLDDYETLLKTTEVDYIGTRLHGGIFALQNKRRAIIIAVDHRAQGMAKENNLIVVNRDDVDVIQDMIYSSFGTKVALNKEGIQAFMSQFAEGE